MLWQRFLIRPGSKVRAGRSYERSNIADDVEPGQPEIDRRGGDAYAAVLVPDRG